MPGYEMVGYRDTEHYQLTRDFLNAPERYHRHLFRSHEEEDDTPDGP